MGLWQRQPQNAPPPVLKSAGDLALMRASGVLVAKALKICRDMAKPGVRTIDIDRAVEAFYAEHERSRPSSRVTPARSRSRA